jgi:hypothetical protein
MTTKAKPMRNRIERKTDRIIIDDGSEGGPWFKMTWDGNRLEVDSFLNLSLTPKSIRILTEWIADTHVQHQ